MSAYCTPVPWEVIDDGQQIVHIAAEYVPDWVICQMARQDPQCDGGRSLDMERANAELIVRSVNSHADLIEALRECRDAIAYVLSSGNPSRCQIALDSARSAIAKAGGVA